MRHKHMSKRTAWVKAMEYLLRPATQQLGGGDCMLTCSASFIYCKESLYLWQPVPGLYGARGK